MCECAPHYKTRACTRVGRRASKRSRTYNHSLYVCVCVCVCVSWFMYVYINVNVRYQPVSLAPRPCMCSWFGSWEAMSDASDGLDDISAITRTVWWHVLCACVCVRACIWIHTHECMYAHILQYAVKLSITRETAAPGRQSVVKHLRMHMFTYICTRAYIYIYTCTYICVCMPWAHAHIYIYVYAYACIFTYTKCMHTLRVCVCRGPRPLHICVHVHIYIYLCKPLCMHTLRVCLCRWLRQVLHYRFEEEAQMKHKRESPCIPQTKTNMLYIIYVCTL